MMNNRDELVEQLTRMAQDAVGAGADAAALVAIKWIGVYGREPREAQS